MDAQKIQGTLQGVFRDVFDNDAIVIDRATTAADVGEWDSFNHVRLIIAAEERFGVSLSTAEVADLRNVGELIDLIARHVNT